jgi:hypothetical protein
VAKAKENLQAETAAAMMRMAKRARIYFTNCSKMGVSCTRPLATRLMVTAKGFCSVCEINGDGEEGHSTVTEVRGWVQECEARNTERIN